MSAALSPRAGGNTNEGIALNIKGFNLSRLPQRAPLFVETAVEQVQAKGRETYTPWSLQMRDYVHQWSAQRCYVLNLPKCHCSVPALDGVRILGKRPHRRGCVATMLHAASVPNCSPSQMKKSTTVVAMVRLSLTSLQRPVLQRIRCTGTSHCELPSVVAAHRLCAPTPRAKRAVV